MNKTKEQSDCIVHTDQSLLLEQGCISIEHKDRPDAEEEELTKTVKQSEKMCILHSVAITIPYTLHCLV